MSRLTSFIGAAKKTLDFAVYDMRFSEALKSALANALRERATAGVDVRICYDGDKPVQPNMARGQDPAPPGTGAFVQSLGYPFRRIGGMKLMHNKFIIRDGHSVWTGSTNLTDDAFIRMENNVVQIDSPPLANYYRNEFEQLWVRENFENTGKIHTDSVPVVFADQSANVRVMFSPGCGLEIDAEIARRVRAAKRRVRIYDATGTHWNDVGAYAAYAAIMGRVGAWFPVEKPLPESAFEFAWKMWPGGDLAALLGLERQMPEVVPFAKPRSPRLASRSSRRGPATDTR
jgi:hypothetical protein